jgi:hypothetical protein
VSSPAGPAATTVNIADTLRFLQTSPGAYITLPSPTNTAPRQLVVYNDGTVPVAIQGSYLLPGQSDTFQWTGSAWVGTQPAKGFGVTAILNGTPFFTFNNGQNVVINGISTVPASTVVYATFDGNFMLGFGGPLSLPSAVGRTGGLSVAGNAAWPFTLVVRNTNLGAPIGNVNGGRQLHFEAVNGVWEWRLNAVPPTTGVI